MFSIGKKPAANILAGHKGGPYLQEKLPIPIWKCWWFLRDQQLWRGRSAPR